MFVELIIIGKIEITFDRRNEAIISFMRMKQCKYRESEKYSVILGRNSEEKSWLKIDFFSSVNHDTSVSLDKFVAFLNSLSTKSSTVVWESDTKCQL